MLAQGCRVRRWPPRAAGRTRQRLHPFGWNRCAALTRAEGAVRCELRPRRSASPSKPPAKAEQQALDERFADDDAPERAPSARRTAIRASGGWPEPAAAWPHSRRRSAARWRRRGNSVRSNARASATANLAQRQNIAADVNGRHGGGKVAHDLLGNAVGVLCRLRDADAGPMRATIWNPQLPSAHPRVRLAARLNGHPKLRLRRGARTARETRSPAASRR